jgi:hypothetical protein
LFVEDKGSPTKATFSDFLSFARAQGVSVPAMPGPEPTALSASGVATRLFGVVKDFWETQVLTAYPDATYDDVLIMHGFDADCFAHEDGTGTLYALGSPWKSVTKHHCNTFNGGSVAKRYHIYVTLDRDVVSKNYACFSFCNKWHQMGQRSKLFVVDRGGPQWPEKPENFAKANGASLPQRLPEEDKCDKYLYPPYSFDDGNIFGFDTLKDFWYTTVKKAYPNATYNEVLVVDSKNPNCWQWDRCETDLAALGDPGTQRDHCPNTGTHNAFKRYHIFITWCTQCEHRDRGPNEVCNDIRPIETCSI